MGRLDKGGSSWASFTFLSENTKSSGLTPGTPSIIFGIDHFVLTVRSVEDSCRFYENVLGLERISTPGKPTALKIGDQKINLQQVGDHFSPKAENPTTGSADFCLITVFPMDEVERRLTENGVEIELGPIERTGAQGPMLSIYFRDPDKNLIEVSRYMPALG